MTQNKNQIVFSIKGTPAIALDSYGQVKLLDPTKELKKLAPLFAEHVIEDMQLKIDSYNANEFNAQNPPTLEIVVKDTYKTKLHTNGKVEFEGFTPGFMTRRWWDLVSDQLKLLAVNLQYKQPITTSNSATNTLTGFNTPGLSNTGNVITSTNKLYTTPWPEINNAFGAASLPEKGLFLMEHGDLGYEYKFLLDFVLNLIFLQHKVKLVGNRSTTGMYANFLKNTKYALDQQVIDNLEFVTVHSWYSPELLLKLIEDGCFVTGADLVLVDCLDLYNIPYRNFLSTKITHESLNHNTLSFLFEHTQTCTAFTRASASASLVLEKNKEFYITKTPKGGTVQKRKQISVKVPDPYTKI